MSSESILGGFFLQDEQKPILPTYQLIIFSSKYPEMNGEPSNTKTSLYHTVLSEWKYKNPESPNYLGKPSFKKNKT